jgi:hypothetical protein
MDNSRTRITRASKKLKFRANRIMTITNSMAGKYVKKSGSWPATKKKGLEEETRY